MYYDYNVNIFITNTPRQILCRLAEDNYDYNVNIFITNTPRQILCRLAEDRLVMIRVQFLKDWKSKDLRTRIRFESSNQLIVQWYHLVYCVRKRSSLKKSKKVIVFLLKSYFNISLTGRQEDFLMGGAKFKQRYHFFC